MKELLGSTTFAKWYGVLLGGALVSAVVYRMIADRESVYGRAMARYLAYLDARFHALFLRGKPSTVITCQAFAAYLVLVATVAFAEPRFLAGLVLAALGPYIYLEREFRQRVTAIEGQVDTLLLALANALKSTPSVGDAFASMKQIMGEPLRSEIDLALKQMRFGSTLDDALRAMAQRIGSRMFDTAIASVLIGQRIGGNLPKILESSAEAMRELRRLDGLVRARTATGQLQLGVMGLAPPTVVVLLERAEPHFFDPLLREPMGMVILVVAAGTWIAAVVIGRRILRVDI